MDAVLAMNAYDASGTTGIITGSTLFCMPTVRFPLGAVLVKVLIESMTSALG